LTGRLIEEASRDVARGKGRPALPLLPAATAKPAVKDSKPFAHPYYWAAFVLVGDGE
jgi:CHAT domain-containing protein